MVGMRRRDVIFDIFFFFHDSPTTEIYTLSYTTLFRSPDAKSLRPESRRSIRPLSTGRRWNQNVRSEEHTSELQSRRDLVCRLLLEKKNILRKVVHISDLALTGTGSIGPNAQHAQLPTA